MKIEAAQQAGHVWLQMNKHHVRVGYTTKTLAGMELWSVKNESRKSMLGLDSYIHEQSLHRSHLSGLESAPVPLCDF